MGPISKAGKAQLVVILVPDCGPAHSSCDSRPNTIKREKPSYIRSRLWISPFPMEKAHFSCDSRPNWIKRESPVILYSDCGSAHFSCDSRPNTKSEKPSYIRSRLWISPLPIEKAHFSCDSRPNRIKREKPSYI